MSMYSTVGGMYTVCRPPYLYRFSLFVCFLAVEWKKKWRSLRDSYMRHRREMRNSKSGQGAGSKKKKWKFMDIMNFLDRYVEDTR